MLKNLFSHTAGLSLAILTSLALFSNPAISATSSTAALPNYPNRPVRLIVPFPPGTATDLSARMLGQQLGMALGQPFIVENKPGAGGSIAAMEVVRANPDGHTLLFSSNSAISSNVALLKNIPYNPNTDFSAVAGIGETVLVLMVKASNPAKNLPELIAHIKRNPGKVTAGYGSSSSQVSISILNQLAGVDVLPVPYKGIPLAVNDVLGNTLDFTFVDIGNAMAQAAGGNMRALGVTSVKRNPLAPDWPSMAEVLPGFEITAWFAIVGPAAMPKAVVDKLNAEVANALNRAEVKKSLASVGITPLPMTSENLKKFIGSEIVKWKVLVKEANIEPQ